MSEQVHITVLVEDTVNARGLQAEHGLAFHVQTGRHQLLFDTGQSDLLIHNARKLNVGLENVEAIILSHGHYDHTGGLAAVREIAPRARCYVHPDALQPKFAGNPDGTSRAAGMSQASLQAIRESAQPALWTSKPTEVLDGIFVTGAIPRTNDFEDTGGHFFLDEACTRPDPLADDQSLFFDTRNGLVVLLGCGHAGVVNTIDCICQVTGNRRIYAVIGGLHLLTASPERIEKTVDAFRRWNVRQIASAHCTGMPAMARLWTAFPDRCFSCAVGARMTFER